MSASVLRLNDAHKSYGAKAAVRGVSLEVAQGQVFGLLGPNGSGKTTTLGIVLGSVRADRGSVTWFGAGSGAPERRRIGALLEQPCYYPWLSGSANLRLFASIKNLPMSAVDEVLKRVGLWDARLGAVQGYSLGMKQRLAIAITLLGKPEVLVLDEPTNGVDAQGIADVRQLIAAFAADGGTVVLASHMLDEVEKVCSHLAIMKDGVVLRAGDIAGVLNTAGWIEVGAEDLDAAVRVLSELEPRAKVERWNRLLLVHAGLLSPAELNRQLLQRGVSINHLFHRQPSLESQYLRLMKGEA